MGLVIPHLARLLVGADHRRLLPTAFWLGAALMLVVDDLARTLTQAEIPIGIITALLGAPLFTLLLVQSRRRSTPDEQLIIAGSATLRPPSAALRPAHAGLPSR
jgi:iron complex transport system permease protein